jgi:hypothetical protein
MKAGPVARWTGSVALGLVLAAVAWARDPGAEELRVLSGPEAVSTIVVRATPETAVEDRTPGARPAAGPRGPASLGETFTGEITLFLPDVTLPRQAVIDVGDPVVSTVRLFPEEHGATVIVFVRQPVTYTVSRPSALGEITIEVRTRTEVTRVTGRTPAGRPRVVRPKAARGEEVAIDAESISYDKPTDTVIARGGVTVTRGNTVLTADEVRYDRTNHTVDARGHVVITEPDGTLDGDTAHLNLDDESGWVDAGTGRLRTSGYSMRGGHIVKHAGPAYSIAQGMFTTCACGGLESPSWSIAGRESTVTVGGVGEVRDATLRVKDVPVLWFPYFVFPAGSDRQSGLLFPLLGQSTKRGFLYSQPVYWAIDKSQDATVTLDLESAARVGLIGEYRYMLSRAAHGAFTLAYFNEGIRSASNPRAVTLAGAPFEPPENRFSIVGGLVQPFVGGSQLVLDLFAVSDKTYTLEMLRAPFSTLTSATRYQNFTTSAATIAKTWEGGAFRLDGIWDQDLLDPQEITQQRLPRARITHGQPLLGDWLVGRISAEGDEFYRRRGYDGLRGDLTPELFLPFHLGRFVTGSIDGQLRETAYHLVDRSQVAFVVPDTPGAVGQFRPVLPTDGIGQLPANRAQESAVVTGRLGTELDRVFEFDHLGYAKLKHTIEPEVDYLYVPATSRPIADRVLPDCRTLPHPLPGNNCDATAFTEGFLFDQQDALNQRNFFSYGITTRLFGRAAPAAEPPTAQAASGGGDGTPPAAPAPPPPARELIRASVMHGYDVSRPLVGTSHLSDVDLGLRIFPTDALVLSWAATANFQDGSLRGQTGGITWRETSWKPPNPAHTFQSPSLLSINYVFVANSKDRFPANSIEQQLLFSGGTNQVWAQAYLRMTDYAGLYFRGQYDFGTSTTPKQFLERDFFLHLISRCDCWLLDAGVSDRINPSETLYRVQFTLVGLGSIGRGAGPQGLLSQALGLGYGRTGLGGAAGLY